MFELKKFQYRAANLICDRYWYFANHDNRPITRKFARPFFQALSAITGAGKTPILAQAVSLIRQKLAREPIVLWMSRARSVVQQTYNNFNGGKYAPLLEDFKVQMVSDLTPELIADSSIPLIAITTTGLFNDKNQEEGARNIYKKSQDKQGDVSLWDRLIERKDGGVRRPLIIVYDEAHNLSDQQSEILSELEPEAYLLASATMKLPANFNEQVIQHIYSWIKESKDDAAFAKLGAVGEDKKRRPELLVTTAVQSVDVVEAELVKRAIHCDGTTAPMERSLDDLLERMAQISRAIKRRGLSFAPKAIYVCKTNVNDDGTQDDPAAPFHMRSAPPIKIWRYLVEKGKVDPKKIAIYADLKFSGKSKPDQVNLFNRGDDDFDKFQEGNFEHIIFNLSLQEGWDDPSCYLAYIDKSMGSRTQVEQIIGRVLRQPGAEHYGSEALDSAHFFLRVDNRTVFADSLAGIRKKLDSEGSPIIVTSTFSSSREAVSEDVGKRKGAKAPLHHVYINSADAQSKIAEILGAFPHFKEGDANSIGAAENASSVVELTGAADAHLKVDWKTEGQTNPVRIRWLLSNAIRAHTPQALKVTDLKGARFDARVQPRSIAHESIRTYAQRIADAYYEFSELAYETSDPYEYEPLRVLKDSSVGFKFSLYPKYSGLQKEEVEFAHALDKARVRWHRNPVSGGYRIPLLTPGDTDHFYPDFLAWKGESIFALDTKGKHLLTDAVARKLFDIFEGNRRRLQVRFIVKGRQDQMNGPRNGKGYTVWRMKGGAPRGFFVDSISQSVAECLKS